MELWDVYDEYRRPTNKTVRRDVDTLGTGEYHLVVHICVFSSDGKLLLQRRAQGHGKFGGLWDVTAAGSAVAGETSKQAAERELKEEMGLVLPLGRASFTVNFEKGFDDIFLTRRDVALSSLVFQKEEVCDAKWATAEEVFAMRAEGLFIPYRIGFLQMLFDLKGKFEGVLER